MGALHIEGNVVPHGDLYQELSGVSKTLMPGLMKLQKADYYLVYLLILLWIYWSQDKTRDSHLLIAVDSTQKMVTGQNKIESSKSLPSGMKKYAVAAIIIAGLLALCVFYYIRSEPTNRFYLRDVRTGKLVGPVSLSKGRLPPSFDEENYVVAYPTESELEIRKRLLRSLVTTKMIDITLTEALDHILTANFGSEAPPVRIDIADESKMPRHTIDVRSVPLYELLYKIAIQAKVYISIENGTIVLSEKKFKAQQAHKNTSEN